ncbi:MAG: hypothetical protein AAB912_03510, partial [Patescibacteria group bacterium]
MSKHVLCAALWGLLPACMEESKSDPGGVAEGKSAEGEGEGSISESEREDADDEGPAAEGEGEGLVCACVSDAECNDGNFCNGTETCNCACQPGTPPNCADQIDCTEDLCANNACTNPAIHARCDAGKNCQP